MKSDSKGEGLRIPQYLRTEVDERDGGFCRMCGAFLGERRAIHHIYYGGDIVGMGGRRHHEIDNLVSLCWAPGDNGCHDRAHSQKAHWQHYLSRVVNNPTNVTALQLARWDARKNR